MSDQGDAPHALRRTPLYDEHVTLGARMLPFGGWLMPIEYSGILDEHRATRTAAGLFDLSHMGEFLFSGQPAAEAISALITNNPHTLAPGHGQYALLCRDDGTCVDDVIVYHLPEPEAGTYLMVVNAANRDKDWTWIQQVTATLGLQGHVQLRDASAATALIAIQGPRAADVLALAAGPLGPSTAELGSFAIARLEVAGCAALAARTGYTGEDGFELFVPAEQAVSLWRSLLAYGQALGIKPIGLGARDTLRLEARLPLFGNDITDVTTPLEAGLGRWVKFDKATFMGKEALAQQKERGLERRLVGITMRDRSIPRAHYGVTSLDGLHIGEVTSGSFAPTIGKGIALAYLPPQYAAVGTALQIVIRGQYHPAEVVKTPFYKRA